MQIYVKQVSFIFFSLCIPKYRRSTKYSVEMYIIVQLQRSIVVSLFFVFIVENFIIFRLTFFGNAVTL